MSDVIDEAQELEEVMKNEALHKFKRKQKDAPKQGREECVRCGKQIPVARRKAVPAAVYCIKCQRETEHV